MSTTTHPTASNADRTPSDADRPGGGATVATDTTVADAEPEGLTVSIDRDAEVPVGLQLGWTLCARIHDGELQPGQRLPGLREMAEASGLNINTVRAVYQRLEQRGLLASRQGIGTFVAATLPRPSAIGTIVADAAREAEAAGADPREIAAALYVAMPPAQGIPAGAANTDTGEEAGAPRVAAARRRALRTQIATLERAIGEIEAEHPGVAPRPAATSPGPGPTLLSAAELEQVRSLLVRRLAAVQAAIDERAGCEAGDGASIHTAATARARTEARKRTRTRIHSEKDSTSAPGSDPSPTPAGSTPKRPARPRSTPRPAAAGT